MTRPTATYYGNRIGQKLTTVPCRRADRLAVHYPIVGPGRARRTGPAGCIQIRLGDLMIKHAVESTVRTISKFSLVMLAVLVPTAAFADANIEAVPTAWRLQNYTGSNMNVFYAGSPCIYGSLVLGASVSADDKNRFWSLILTAKATGKTVGIFYETTSGACNITSFYTAN